MKFKHLVVIALVFSGISVAGALVVGQAENIFMTSVERGWSEPAVVALVLGADIEATDLEGRTPLMIAALRDDAGMAKLLIRLGSNVDSRSPKGRTPLMIAAIEGHRKVAEQLIDADANVKLKDKALRKAAWHARKNGHQELWAQLNAEEYGAPPVKVTGPIPGSTTTQDSRPRTQESYSSGSRSGRAQGYSKRHTRDGTWAGKPPDYNDETGWFKPPKVSSAESPSSPSIH